MKKLITVVGARPQFIKASALSRVFKNMDGIKEIIVHTGQHFDENMSNVFFDELDIPAPLYNLGIAGGPHGQMTGRQLEKIEELLLVERPDWVLVYGDTNSTLAGALAASKLGIPLVHIEAGLRSYNRSMPEEINRVLVDHISNLLCCPTVIAVENLIREGIDATLLANVGDVMYDVALYGTMNAKCPVWFSKAGLSQYALLTIHRASTVEDCQSLGSIMEGLAKTDVKYVFPCHPRTHNAIKAMSIDIPKNVYVVSPVSYLEMMWLEMNSLFVMTDSGGVQKEAYFHKKPCITLRNETEWKELVDIGVNRLVGVDSLAIVAAVAEVGSVDFPEAELYGNGNAAERCAQLMVR